MSPSCPRCGAPGKEEQGRIRVNHEERLDFTHRCSDERCAAPFRYEPRRCGCGSAAVGGPCIHQPERLARDLVAALGWGSPPGRIP